MAMTLDELNAASPEEALRLLDGIYEHSPWVAQAAIAQRPFASVAQLAVTMAAVVTQAGRDRQLALIRAHPELAGKGIAPTALTADSRGEQGRAGLVDCTPAELEKLHQLNAEYRERFGFPFVLAVRGPRGSGLTRGEIIEIFERRLSSTPDFEFAECLRNIHRIAELRLKTRFAQESAAGDWVWDRLQALAEFSEPEFAQRGQLTVTYLTDAHRAAAARIEQDMRDCGFDEVEVDGLGNVVGTYRAGQSADVLAGQGAAAPTLLTGSHYDTVRNAGRFDGRLGIYTPMACVRTLAAAGRRLPFDIEVVGFSEEEGQRFKATFLGSGALVGQFDYKWLDQRDADSISLREAMLAAGLPATQASIRAIERDPSRYLGFVEVHIEQGPVLNELNLPLGVVTSINGGVRLQCEAIGTPSHAGTTPMDRRHDAALAVAELALFVERRARQDGDSVGTVGMLQVPGGSINVVPGRCRFSLDLRAPNDAQRDRLVQDVLAEFSTICTRRGVRSTVEETMRAGAAPSSPEWQARWERAVQALGLPVHRMPSGAGHDAMKLHAAMPQAMLFVRGENSGISHNPLESSTSDDIELAVAAFTRLLEGLAREHD